MKYKYTSLEQAQQGKATKETFKNKQLEKQLRKKITDLKILLENKEFNETQFSIVANILTVYNQLKKPSFFLRTDMEVLRFSVYRYLVNESTNREIRENLLLWTLLLPNNLYSILMEHCKISSPNKYMYKLAFDFAYAYAKIMYGSVSSSSGEILKNAIITHPDALKMKEKFTCQTVTELKRTGRLTYFTLNELSTPEDKLFIAELTNKEV